MFESYRHKLFKTDETKVVILFLIEI